MWTCTTLWPGDDAGYGPTGAHASIDPPPASYAPRRIHGLRELTHIFPIQLIESLEPRIAPAALFAFAESDGDSVTIKTSKGANTDLATAVTLDPTNAFIASINRTAPIFAGTNPSIVSKPGGVEQAEIHEAVNETNPVRISAEQFALAIGDPEQLGIRRLTVGGSERIALTPGPGNDVLVLGAIPVTTLQEVT